MCIVNIVSFYVLYVGRYIVRDVRRSMVSYRMARYGAKLSKIILGWPDHG
jgi:hypothetical protein